MKFDNKIFRWENKEGIKLQEDTVGIDLWVEEDLIAAKRLSVGQRGFVDNKFGGGSYYLKRIR